MTYLVFSVSFSKIFLDQEMKLSAALILQSVFIIVVHGQSCRPWTAGDCQRVRLFLKPSCQFKFPMSSNLLLINAVPESVVFLAFLPKRYKVLIIFFKKGDVLSAVLA